MTIVKIIAQLNAAKAAIPTIVSESIDETQDDYVAGIKKQLFDGFDGDGDRLQVYQNYYANFDGTGIQSYPNYKNKLNPKPGYGNPDLNLTGKYYAGIGIHVEGNNVFSGSTDSKDEALQTKYGPNILKLGGTYNDEYVHVSLAPVVKKNLTELTNLRFT